MSMAPPVSRCRRKLPPSPARTMDLLGIGKDGQLYLWEAAQQVQPISRFERSGSGIKCGHYVIEYDRAAVTVHCGNLVDGRVVVQFMCGGERTVYLERKYVEAMLLGKVIPDPVAAAKISDMLRRLTEEAEARQTAPHRRRGQVG